MMTKKIDKKRDQMMVFCMDDMVPQDHLLRLINRAIDWSFIYESGGSADGDRAKTRKCSTTDPESGWFRKGEHKHVFAYAVETACDKNGWILGYTVHPGNEHDSHIFKPLRRRPAAAALQTTNDKRRVF